MKLTFEIDDSLNVKNLTLEPGSATFCGLEAKLVVLEYLANDLVHVPRLLEEINSYCQDMAKNMDLI